MIREIYRSQIANPDYYFLSGSNPHEEVMEVSSMKFKLRFKKSNS